MYIYIHAINHIIYRRKITKTKINKLTSFPKISKSLRTFQVRASPYKCRISSIPFYEGKVFKLATIRDLVTKW